MFILKPVGLDSMLNH